MMSGPPKVVPKAGEKGKLDLKGVKEALHRHMSSFFNSESLSDLEVIDS